MKLQLLSYLEFLTLFCAFLSTFGCSYPDCDYVDYGSCGNACCRLFLKIKNENSENVMKKLNSTIFSGGPDSRYISQMTAEGTLNFADIRPYKLHVDFIGQTWHTTTNLMYNDTINFLLKSHKNDTNVFAVSISQIAGAYGDAGQGYFNIKQLFDSVDWDEGTYALKNADQSCPPLRPTALRQNR
jgi:hypothetical protein